MYFDSFAELVQMGRHGAYVWSAYGISLCLIISSLVMARSSERKAKDQIRRMQRRQQAAAAMEATTNDEHGTD